MPGRDVLKMIDRSPARVSRIGQLLGLRSLPIVERAAGFLQIFLDECGEFFLLRRRGRVPLQAVTYVLDPPLDSLGIGLWRGRLSYRGGDCEEEDRESCWGGSGPHLTPQQQDEDHAHVI
ncbi:MAG: hypothetical protein ABSG03_22985 [Bryobacteraceae bacterium]